MDWEIIATVSLLLILHLIDAVKFTFPTFVNVALLGFLSAESDCEPWLKRTKSTADFNEPCILSPMRHKRNIYRSDPEKALCDVSFPTSNIAVEKLAIKQ